MNVATTSSKTTDLWVLLATKWHSRCLDAETNGHGERWYRSDLEDELRPVLEENGKSDDQVRAWFDKVSLTSLSVDLPFALDMDLVPGKGPKYFWRHDGQLPAGMLTHRANIVRGMSHGMLNLVWKLGAEDYGADELVDTLGESALPCVVLARVAAYSCYEDTDERQNVLAALSDVEAEVAAKLEARGIRDVYEQVFTPLLTAKVYSGEDEVGIPVRYFCAVCEDWFAAPVRHCPECDHHYPEQECGNCHHDNSNIEQAKARDAEENA